MRNLFFTVRHPARAITEGLFACLKAGLHFVGVSGWLIGFECDGACVNIAFRGFLKQYIPWIVVFWIFAHRLELGLKDVLANTCFPVMDELLLCIY